MSKSQKLPWLLGMLVAPVMMFIFMVSMLVGMVAIAAAALTGQLKLTLKDHEPSTLGLFKRGK